LLQKGVLHFAFKLNQLSEIVLRRSNWKTAFTKLEFTQTKNALFWKGLGT